MHINTIDADHSHPDFAALTTLLDNELSAVYGADVMQTYNPHNLPQGIFRAVIVYCDGEPSACGGIRRFNDDSVEIKRMFVRPERRRLGLGEIVMRRLETLAAADGFTRAVLETASDMTSALSLYHKRGFVRTENYGPYADDPLCVCMEKRLSV